MPSVRLWPMRAWKDGGWTALARIPHPLTAANIQQSELATITVSVAKGNGTVTFTATLTISAVIFNTLQTGSVWTEDSTGYNFKYEVPAEAFPTVGPCRVTFTFTPASSNGEVFYVVWEGAVRNPV